MPESVAIIRASVSRGTHRVTIRGSLAASDLRRLEQVCGPALEQRDLQLEVRLIGVPHIDESSQLFLAGLVRRGALLRT